MPNQLKNWKFKDVERFLRAHGFYLHHTNGSHYYYLGKDMQQVCVPFHGSKAIKPRTMKGIIIQSGVNQVVWFGKNAVDE